MLLDADHFSPFSSSACLGVEGVSPRAQPDLYDLGILGGGVPWPVRRVTHPSTRWSQPGTPCAPRHAWLGWADQADHDAAPH